MEGKKHGSSTSSSSFTADLFGVKEHSPPQHSTGIFASIFPPPSKVVGRNSPSSEFMGSWQKHAQGNQAWNIRQGNQAISSEGACCSIPNKGRSSVLQEERVEPCHLSSSIYYGGQDVYPQSQSTQISGSHPTLKKDGGEDDPNASGGASRGNWWFAILLEPCLPKAVGTFHLFWKGFMRPDEEWQKLCNINKLMQAAQA